MNAKSEDLDIGIEILELEDENEGVEEISEYFFIKYESGLSSPVTKDVLISWLQSGRLHENTEVCKLMDGTVGQNELLKEVLSASDLEQSGSTNEPLLTNTAKDAQETLDTINKILKPTKGAVDSLAKIMSNEELIEKTKKISSYLGSCSAALGIVSVGLDLFIDSKSIEDEIFDKICELESKIDELQNTILKEFDQLKDFINYAQARDTFVKNSNLLKAWGGHVSQYKKYLDKAFEAKQQDMQDEYTKQMANAQEEHRHLSELTTPQIEEHALELANLLAGPGTMRDDEYFEFDYIGMLTDISYGKADVLVEVSQRLLEALTSAMALDALVAGIHSAKDLGPDIEQLPIETREAIGERIQNTYAPILDMAKDRIKQERKTLEKKKVQSKYIKAYAEKYVYNTTPSGNRNAAKHVRDMLAKQYDYLEFLVVVTDDVSGSDNHGVCGRRFYARFRQNLGNNGKCNLSVCWIRKDLEYGGVKELSKKQIKYLEIEGYYKPSGERLNYVNNNFNSMGRSEKLKYAFSFYNYRARYNNDDPQEMCGEWTNDDRMKKIDGIGSRIRLLV